MPAKPPDRAIVDRSRRCDVGFLGRWAGGCARRCPASRRPRRRRACGSGCSATGVHNPLRSTVVVHYPFHPLAGRTIEVAAKARRDDGAVTLRGVDAHDLKIPTWMLRPEAANAPIVSTATLDPVALRALLELARTSCPALDAPRRGTVAAAPRRGKRGTRGADNTSDQARSNERAGGHIERRGTAPCDGPDGGGDPGRAPSRGRTTGGRRR